jgi:hypothetical protein
MNALIQFLKKPVALAIFVLIACLYVLHSTSTRFVSDMRKDRDEMVASLRQAQTPEPQIAAIFAGFDCIISDVDSMATSFFAFTSVVLVCAFAVRHKGSPHQDTQSQAHGELKHDQVV